MAKELRWVAVELQEAIDIAGICWYSIIHRYWGEAEDTPRCIINLLNKNTKYSSHILLLWLVLMILSDSFITDKSCWHLKLFFFRHKFEIKDAIWFGQVKLVFFLFLHQARSTRKTMTMWNFISNYLLNADYLNLS